MKSGEATRQRPSARPRRWRTNCRGTSLLELMVTATILAILATVALPLGQVSRRRQQELELRRSLREIRLALDAYHAICRSSAPGRSGGNVPGQREAIITMKIENDPGLTCYPKKLEVLIEGVETNVPKYKLRFLRRIPEDPFNYNDEEHDEAGWKLRSTSDRPDGLGWDRKNVFDVKPGNDFRALDGSYYRDW